MSRFSPGSQRRGLTLIEVMAGLALLASLLVMLLLARSRCMQQWARANRRLEAAAAADALLGQWWQDLSKLPRESSGEVAGQLAWRTCRVPNAQAAQLGAQVLRLEILDQRDLASDGPLVSVEILVSDEKPSAQDRLHAH